MFALWLTSNELPNAALLDSKAASSTRHHFSQLSLNDRLMIIKWELNSLDVIGNRSCSKFCNLSIEDRLPQLRLVKESRHRWLSSIMFNRIVWGERVESFHCAAFGSPIRCRLCIAEYWEPEFEQREVNASDAWRESRTAYPMNRRAACPCSESISRLVGDW